MSNPTDSDWLAVKRLFRYLKGSLHHGLLLHKPKTISLISYSDADYGSNILDGITSAYLIFFGSNPISALEQAKWSCVILYQSLI